jgi:hypothetical protein
MKKIYSLVLGLVISGSLIAQENTQIGKIKLSPSNNPVKPVVNSSNQQKVILYGPYGFDTPTDWTTVDNTGVSGDNWIVGTQAPQGFYSNGMGPIASTSGGNFASYDSDYLGEDDNGTSPQNADIYYSTPFDLSGNLAVAVEFESYYRAFQGNCYVIASTDGVNWTEVSVHDDIAVNTDTGNPLVTTANVSAIVGGSSTAYIGFRYIGQWDYAWMVDDVSIVTLPDNDIGLIKGWHHDPILDWEYSMTPLTQARPLTPGVLVQNQGGMSQTVDVTCTISDGSGVVNTTTIPGHVSNVGTTDTLWFTTNYTPGANDVYTIEFSVPTDLEPSDDSYTASTLEVNNFLMAHDYGALGSWGWNPGATDPSNANNPHSWGTIYSPTVDQDVYGVDVQLDNATTAGMEFTVNIWEIDPNNQGDWIQDPLNQLASIYWVPGSGEIGSPQSLYAGGPIGLVAGKSYIFDVNIVNGVTAPEAFYIAGSDTYLEDDDFSTVGYGDYGSGGTTWYNGWGFAPYIRANFDPSLGIDEPTIEGVSIYPNPSEGLINVSNDNNTTNTIEVTDVAGNVVINKEVSTESSFDLSAHGAGVYMVKVSNENGFLVEKVVIK